MPFGGGEFVEFPDGKVVELADYGDVMREVGGLPAEAAAFDRGKLPVRDLGQDYRGAVPRPVRA